MGNEVDLLKRLHGVAMVKSIQETDDILMVHVLEQAQFTKCSLGMSGSLKGTVKFLDCHFCVCSRIYCRAENLIIE